MDILIHQETLLHRYETRQSKSEIQRLLHPDFREIGRSGTEYNIDSIVDMMKQEEPSSDTLHAQNFVCSPIAHDTQLLTYESAIIDADGNIRDHAKHSSIWVLTDKNWQIRFHQGTPCAEFELITAVTYSAGSAAITQRHCVYPSNAYRVQFQRASTPMHAQLLAGQLPPVEIGNHVRYRLLLPRVTEP